MSIKRTSVVGILATALVGILGNQTGATAIATIQLQMANADMAQLSGSAIECSNATSDDLVQAARDGETSSVHRLLDCSISANNRGRWTQDIADGAPLELMAQPIHAAAWNGHTEIVQILLDAGAYADAIDEWGFSPLMTAAEVGEVQIVDLLIEAGVDVNRATRCAECIAETALMIAVEYEHEAVVERLLRAGADKSYRAKDGLDSLDLARARENASIIQMLEE